MTQVKGQNMFNSILTLYFCPIVIIFVEVMKDHPLKILKGFHDQSQRSRSNVKGQGRRSNHVKFNFDPLFIIPIMTMFSKVMKHHQLKSLICFHDSRSKVNVTS